MNLSDVAFLLAGIAIVAFALGSAIRTVVPPRAAPDPISRTIFRASCTVFAGIARRCRSCAARDRITALLAPVGLASLLLAPPAQRSSARSLTDWRRPPALRRWGRRLLKARS